MLISRTKKSKEKLCCKVAEKENEQQDLVVRFKKDPHGFQRFAHLVFDRIDRYAEFGRDLFVGLAFFARHFKNEFPFGRKFAKRLFF